MKSWIDVDKSHTWVYVVLKCTCNNRYDKKASSAKVLFRVCRDTNEYLFELVNIMSGYFNYIGFSLPVSGLCPFNPTVLRFYDNHLRYLSTSINLKMFRENIPNT